MDLKILFTVFSAVFIAELGDKTQIATMLFATDNNTSRITVFLAASLALILSSLIAVSAGSLISNCIGEKTLHAVAGIGFICIGIWTLIRI